MPNQKTSVKKFTITFIVTSTLTEKELWYDSPPANPTVDDVQKLIDADGGIYRVLDGWNLLNDSDYSITEMP